MLPLLMTLALDFQPPDRSFTIAVPAGWKAQYHSQLNMTVLDPPGGGAGEKILVGSGVALVGSIQELSQQAAALTAQMFPGARLSSTPKFSGNTAEQEYRNQQYSGWNGMLLKDGFYFAALVIAPSAQFANAQNTGRELFRTAKFHGVPRNAQAEAAIVGAWSKSSYQSTRTGVRDNSNYSANWTVQYLPGNRFVSTQENYFHTESQVYGGGNVGSSNRATGTYRIHGNTLIVDLDGGGRQSFQLEFYPDGSAIKANGQLFLRQ
jgi:hypothetical protein